MAERRAQPQAGADSTLVGKALNHRTALLLRDFLKAGLTSHQAKFAGPGTRAFCTIIEDGPMKRPGLLLAAILLSCGSWEAMAEDAPPAAGSDANPVYVDLAPLVLPVIEGDRIQQVLQFTITMEVTDQKAAQHITDVKPRLTDAFIQDLYGALDRRRLMDGKMLDVARLRDELTRVSIGVLGENSFRAILIQRVSQRMM